MMIIDRGPAFQVYDSGPAGDAPAVAALTLFVQPTPGVADHELVALCARQLLQTWGPDWTSASGALKLPSIFDKYSIFSLQITN
jgi:hypothetical protein